MMVLQRFGFLSGNIAGRWRLRSDGHAGTGSGDIMVPTLSLSRLLDLTFDTDQVGAKFCSCSFAGLKFLILAGNEQVQAYLKVNWTLQRSLLLCKVQTVRASSTS